MSLLFLKEIKVDYNGIKYKFHKRMSLMIEIDNRLKLLEKEEQTWLQDKALLNEILNEIKRFNEENNNTEIISNISFLIGQLDSRQGYIKNQRHEIPWKYLILLETLIGRGTIKNESLLGMKQEFLLLKDLFEGMYVTAEEHCNNIEIYKAKLHFQKTLVDEILAQKDAARNDLEKCKEEYAYLQKRLEKEKRSQKDNPLIVEAKKQLDKAEKTFDAYCVRISAIQRLGVFSLEESGEDFLSLDVKAAAKAKSSLKKIVDSLDQDKTKSPEEVETIISNEIDCLKALLIQLSLPQEGGKLAQYVERVCNAQDSKTIDEVREYYLAELKSIHMEIHKISCYQKEDNNNIDCLNNALKKLETCKKSLGNPPIQKSAKKKVKEKNVPLMVKNVFLAATQELHHLLETENLPSQKIGEIQTAMNHYLVGGLNIEDKKQALQVIEEAGQLLKECIKDFKGKKEIRILDIPSDSWQILSATLQYCYREFDLMNMEAIVKNLANFNYNDFKDFTYSKYCLLQLLLEIGESAKDISSLIKAGNPKVPLELLRHLRNKLFHNAMDVTRGLKTLGNFLTTDGYINDNVELSNTFIAKCADDLVVLKNQLDELTYVLSQQTANEYSLMSHNQAASEGGTIEVELKDFEGMFPHLVVLYEFFYNFPCEIVFDNATYAVHKEELEEVATNPYQEVTYRLQFIIGQLKNAGTFNEQYKDNAYLPLANKFFFNLCGQVFKTLVKFDEFSLSLSPSLKELITKIIITRGDLAHDIVLKAVALDSNDIKELMENCSKFESLLEEIKLCSIEKENQLQQENLLKHSNSLCNAISNQCSGFYNVLRQMKKENYNLDTVDNLIGKTKFHKRKLLFEALQFYLEDRENIGNHKNQIHGAIKSLEQLGNCEESIKPLKKELVKLEWVEDPHINGELIQLKQQMLDRKELNNFDLLLQLFSRQEKLIQELKACRKNLLVMQVDEGMAVEISHKFEEISTQLHALHEEALVLATQFDEELKKEVLAEAEKSKEQMDGELCSAYNCLEEKVKAKNTPSISVFKKSPAAEIPLGRSSFAELRQSQHCGDNQKPDPSAKPRHSTPSHT